MAHLKCNLTDIFPAERRRHAGERQELFIDATRQRRINLSVSVRPSALVNTGIICCGDNLDQTGELFPQFTSSGR